MTIDLPAIIARLKADLVYHQDESDRITRESLDIDTAPEGAYSVEADTEESYHTGRVEALGQVLMLLQGQDVKLYSETGDEEPGDSRAGASVRPTLASLDAAFAGDAVAELVYDTLVDRGMEPAQAAAAMSARYDYEPFGKLVDDIEDHDEEAA